MTDEALALYRRLAGVQRLADRLRVADVHGGADVAQEREYALQRAAVSQDYRNHLEQQDTAVADLAVAVVDAQETAVRLRDFDARHGTGRGPVPPGDARWQDAEGAAGYVEQEVTQGQARE